MFTTVAALRKTTAQRDRVNHLEMALARLMTGTGNTYTENTIIPMFVIASTNDQADCEWVMNTPSARVPVPVLESQLSSSAAYQDGIQALGWRVKAERIDEVVNKLIVLFVNTMKEQPGNLMDEPNNGWFRAMALAIEVDKALPFDECRFPEARGDVAVAVAAQADGIVEVSPDQVASDVLNEAAEQRIVQAIDSFTATVSNANAQMAWLTTHGHSFKEIVTKMIRDGEITVDDLNAAS